MPGKRRHALFSTESNFMDDEASLSRNSQDSTRDMFDVSPPCQSKRPKAAASDPVLEGTVHELPSTQEFAAGLQVFYIKKI
jgi:hypothetical protein